MQYAKACIKLGYDYFEAKLLQLDVGFKAAFIFNTNFLKPDRSSIDTLHCFNFLDTVGWPKIEVAYLPCNG